MTDIEYTHEHPWSTRRRGLQARTSQPAPRQHDDETLRRYRDTVHELLSLLEREAALYARLQELDASCELSLQAAQRTDTLSSRTWPKHLLRKDLAILEAQLIAKRKGDIV